MNLSLASQTEPVASSFLSSSFLPAFGADGDLNTSWCSASGDAANLGGTPFFEVVLPGPATVSEVRIFSGRFGGNEIFAGIFELFGADGTLLETTGEVSLPPPDRDLAVPVGVAVC